MGASVPFLISRKGSSLQADVDSINETTATVTTKDFCISGSLSTSRITIYPLPLPTGSKHSWAFD